MKKVLLAALTLSSFNISFSQTTSPSWTVVQNSSFPITTAGVRFLDAVDQNTVWLIGYDGFAPNLNYNMWSKTTDGGFNYTTGNVFPDTNTYRLANLEGIDGNIAWVSAYTKAGNKGGVFKTTNGGGNWINMNSAQMFTHTSSFCNLVSFLNPSVGIVQGDPNPDSANEFDIWRTADGGATWTAVPGANIPDPLPNEFGIVNIYTKQGSSNYWFGTNMNRIFRSTDAGLTWSVAPQLTSTLGPAVAINAIAFTDANNGIAEAYFGSPGSGNLVLFNSTDGGASWNAIPSVDPNFGRNGICAIQGTNWFASTGAGVGNNVISFSADNGVTWNSWGGSDIQYIKVDFVDPSTGWAGSFGDQITPGLAGIYKYNGPSLLQGANANFTLAPTGCINFSVSVGNISGGNPFPSYSWSVEPAAGISNSTATNPNFLFTNTGTYTITLTATNFSNTSTTTRTISIGTCVGIEENILSAQNIYLYPNPSSDFIHIEVPGIKGFEISLKDVFGKSLFYSGITTDKQNINVKDFPKGIYFLEIKIENQKAVKKLIVE